MHRPHTALRAAWLLAALLVSGPHVSAQTIQVWRTTADRRLALTPQPSLRFEPAPARKSAAPGTASTPGSALAPEVVQRWLADPIIEVDPDRAHQTILGMGASLEHTTCSNLFRLAAADRRRALERLVHPQRGIGMNLMRVCIGTSDFTGEPWYSYNDQPPGQTDPELRHFSIERDRAYILPVLKEARRLNPQLLFFASAWSPPGWMKTTGSMIGGELLPEYHAVYAQYLVKFIQAYAREGLPIHALTVQNEPGVDRAREKDPKWHYPSCHWNAFQERDFIRDHLGPALRRAGLPTRIWCYDHNYNESPKDDSAGLEHPRTILRDPAAAAWVDAVAFHHYEGQPSGMTRFHEEFPDRRIVFSEGSVFSIWGAYDLTERFRNWSTTYNAWVVMLDDQGRPNLGPFPATHAILKLHSDTLRVEELFEFYCYGHFMKFVERGAVRVASDPSFKELSNVAFRNPDGRRVLIAVNTGPEPRPLRVLCQNRQATTSLPPESILTLTWSP